MSLNPYEIDIKNIDKKLDQKYEFLATTKQKCEWYLSTNQTTLQTEKSSLENYRNKIKRDINETTQSITNMLNELSDLKKSNLNKNMIQRLITKNKTSSKIKDLELEIEKSTNKVNNLTDTQSTLLNDIEKKGVEISSHLKFDYEKQALIIKLLENEIKDLCTDKTLFISKRDDFNYLIEEDLETINKTEEKIKNKEIEISKLESLIKKISQCKNTEKNEILSTFSKQHPNMQPTKLLVKLKNSLSKLESDLKKVKTAVEIKAKREKRVIEKIIIDGNNLCHESGSRGKFIGLNALATLIPMLECKGLDFIIVFDSSIHKTFLYTDILNTFGNHVDFIVSDGKADETIVKLANNENYYIISNDKFIEYKDHPVVARDGVLRHNIIDNIILINDLDIQLNLISNL